MKNQRRFVLQPSNEGSNDDEDSDISDVEILFADAPESKYYA